MNELEDLIERVKRLENLVRGHEPEEEQIDEETLIEEEELVEAFAKEQEENLAAEFIEPESLSLVYKYSKARGKYVYAWLDNGAVFYIGRGIGRRVISNAHGDSCQTWRKRIGARFSWVIIRDNLTDEGAILLESVLIDVLRPACNMAGGVSRQEIPPLVLPRDVLGYI